tara:strand:+ start:1601 stop:3106 length:1506 start_codon:yes stop_codon:yes gene_type:complete
MLATAVGFILGPALSSAETSNHMADELRFSVIVKQDCPTCRLIEPALVALSETHGLDVYCQDDVNFPASIRHVTDDTSLEYSYHQNIETVPTLVRFEAGVEVGRTEGWDRAAWRDLTSIETLGETLTTFQPGCGSLSVAPGMPEQLAIQYGGLQFGARRVELDEREDPVEAMYARGWSDGLPVVAPTDVRIARMLSGTERAADEVVGLIPPNLVECTVEKVAINAVMAGCKSEYMPVILTALEAALEPLFSMHGLLCTTWFSGPAIIVNGPIARRVGLNAQGNVFGQGNRANSTIGRALQLVIRNVGGGRPGEIDRAVFGHPGKVGFCFAEDESDDDWLPLHVARGCAPGSSAVTLFHGDGVHGIRGHRARSAQELARTLAAGLVGVCHPKLYGWSGAILAISPDHYAVFQREGYGRAEIEAAVTEALRKPGHDVIEGAHGLAEGIDPSRADELVDKFHPGSLLVVRAGGTGSLLSAVIGGWAAMRRPHEVQPITREIVTN